LQEVIAIPVRGRRRCIAQREILGQFAQTGQKLDERLGFEKPVRVLSVSGFILRQIKPGFLRVDDEFLGFGF
jgi:hypothetical protein